ncbi:MAG: aspartyl protease family protein [Bacteroidales bacterium]|nr:aspartyl protease family protein [Bacteroidales bacterium]
MKKLKTNIIASLLSFGLLLMCFVASGQIIGFEIINQNGKTTFGFEKVNNLVIIPVMLNGQLPLNFILDTGVRTTILTDRTISDIVNISYDRSVTIAGAGHIRELNAYLATNVSLSMPGINGQGQSLIVLEEDYLELRTHLGMNVHGIIGYEFFNHFVVMIDYQSNLITVYDPDVFKPRRNFTAIPITIEQGRPYIEASMTQFEGSVFNPKLLIDSGASHGLLLEKDSDEDILLPEDNLATIIGWGLGGELKGSLGRIKNLSINKFEFEDVLASFTEDYSSPDVNLLTNRNGSIGGDLLSRFTIVIDYNGRMIYLRKSRAYSYPFEFNLGGIDIIADGVDFNTFRIINVIEGSPAFHAGLKNDDIIVAINGKNAISISLTDINNILRSKPGSRVVVVLNRDNEIIRTSFRLKRMI